MEVIKKICVITPNYPNRYSIERGAFVEDLVKGWEKALYSVDVVAPITIPNFIRHSRRGSNFKRVRAGRNIVEPLIFSFGAYESDLPPKIAHT